jgi:hypothetical protein
MNSPNYRRNNFNMWPIEDSLIGKAVYVDMPDSNENFNRLAQPFGWRFPQEGVIHGYYSFSRVLFSKIRCTDLKERSIQINTTVALPKHYLALFQQPAYSETSIWVALYVNGDVHDYINTGTTVKSLTSNTLTLTVTIPAYISKGEYTARLCIGTVLPGFPSINSTEFDLNVQ